MVILPSLTSADEIPEISRLPWPPASNNPLDRGLPALDQRGIVYVRSGDKIIVINPTNGASYDIDFAGSAAHSIDRDIFQNNGRWDRSWDSGPMVDNDIVFDGRGYAYTIVVPRYSNLDSAVLLMSNDNCVTWQAIKLSGRNATIEKRSIIKPTNSWVPSVLSFESYGKYEGTRLWLELYSANNGSVKSNKSIIVSDRSLLVANHSGGANSSISFEDKIIISYPVKTDRRQGTLSVAREFETTSETFRTGEIPIGWSATLKGPDNHDLPGLALMPDGKILAIVGAHQALLRVTMSSAVATIEAGWGEPIDIGEPMAAGRYGRFTYPSLDVASDGSVNVIARAEGDRWRFQLVQLRRDKHGVWTTWPNGLKYRVIVSPEREAYMAWRHHVSTAPDGTIYLNYRPYANQLTYAESKLLGVEGGRTADCSETRCWYIDAPTGPAHTIASSDGGITWKRPGIAQ